jgi:hypothetical protein
VFFTVTSLSWCVLFYLIHFIIYFCLALFDKLRSFSLFSFLLNWSSFIYFDILLDSYICFPNTFNYFFSFSLSFFFSWSFDLRVSFCTFFLYSVPYSCISWFLSSFWTSSTLSFALIYVFPLLFSLRALAMHLQNQPLSLFCSWS